MSHPPFEMSSASLKCALSSTRCQKLSTETEELTTVRLTQDLHAAEMHIHNKNAKSTAHEDEAAQSIKNIYISLVNGLQSRKSP